VASRVVFIDGRPVPSLYRKFNIKSVDGINDFASIEEVLERRFRRIPDNKDSTDDPWAIPDLVIVDGGKGQLSSAIKGMMKAGVRPYGNVIQMNGEIKERGVVSLCALAKENEEVFIPGVKDPVNSSSDSPALLLLRQLRDESHRFALNAHRTRRSIKKST
jgi:excinuclease ABC subunit C